MHDAPPDQDRLERLKPDPIPAIHPLPEYLVDGDRKGFYDDTKAVLQVPWMGVVTMAFSHYPGFYATLWHGVRELCLSAEFIAACARLRRCAETAAGTLSPSPIRPQLEALGYAPREIDQIGEMLEIFSHGNMPYLLLATQARLLLEGGALSGQREATPDPRRHAPQVSVPLVLLEPHHVEPAIRALYDDIRATLGLPFVNTDYRALARWPTYFTQAWNDLRAHPPTARYAHLAEEIHVTAVDLVRTLPNPGGLTSAALQAAANADATVDEILAVVRLFQWLLPGLVLNVAHFRAQLEL
jgi:hypothetical protein